jgi:hypothetical protein
LKRLAALDTGLEHDRERPLVDVALALEELALRNPHFVERTLYPNVDFYSGLIYKALKVPTGMFTVMFAIARTAGVGRTLAGAARRPRNPHRPPAPDLLRSDQPRLRADGQALRLADGSRSRLQRFCNSRASNAPTGVVICHPAVALAALLQRPVPS